MALALCVCVCVQATISSEEWEDRMQSDVTTSSSYSTSNSESELSENADNLEENEDDELANEYLPANGFHGINLLQPVSKPFLCGIDDFSLAWLVYCSIALCPGCLLS